MHMSTGHFPRWFRSAFGRPRIVHAVLWGILSLGGIALGLKYARDGVHYWWMMLLLAAWALALAIVFLVVAMRDRRRGTGAYGAPEAHRMHHD